MKRFFLLLSIVLAPALFAGNYIPIDTANFKHRKELSKLYLERSKKYVDAFRKEYSGKEKSYIRKHFENRSKEFNEELLHGDYVFDTRFDAMLDSIVKHILRPNELDSTDICFYVSRDLSLNALSFGDKTFVVNMGAFYFLENDNEMAAIIAHEMAHYILQHNIRTLQRHYKIEKVDSRNELSQIRSDKYNRGTKALERYKALMYADENQNRQDEHEADSLGYVLYKKSGFPAKDYLNSFILMAEYDSVKPSGLKTRTYEKFFNFEGLTFKKEWLKAEDFSKYDYSKFKSKFNKDSLQSHPEVDKRIKRLKELFSELRDSGTVSEPSKRFESLQRIAMYEQLPNIDFDENYGNGVYLCLLRLQRDSTDEYHKEWMGRMFNKIYDARKTYTLNRYLDRVDPKDQSESYQQFLNFMWNLNLNELKRIAEHYSKKEPAKL